MENIKLNLENANSFLGKDFFAENQDKINNCQTQLKNKSGKGNDFLGWVDLPSNISQEEILDIKKTGEELRSKSDFIVVIGIGGSYLGAKAVIDAVSPHFMPENTTKVLFAGQNISQDYLFELQELLADKSFSIIVISKSGTTTEPAIAFRLLKKMLEEKCGKEEAQKRIVAITDASKGALRMLAEKENYKTFPIADDIGGRFSVLSPVGLLPVAAAGYDIKKLVEGAITMQNSGDKIIEEYALCRFGLYNSGKTIEILANYNPKLVYFSEWWKQLYGESEGKENKGIFPASVTFSADLHSMGQYIQEGPRNLFETVISVQNPNHKLQIPSDENNLDKLNYIAGKDIDEVNKMAELGTCIAHVDGDVPNIQISIPKISEYYIGQLIYFFEKACALSGYLIDVNPFDQPGVEAYKSNMFALLGKPGFEKETEEIKRKLK